jgi:hypothetical protein
VRDEKCLSDTSGNRPAGPAPRGVQTLFIGAAGGVVLTLIGVLVGCRGSLRR